MSNELLDAEALNPDQVSRFAAEIKDLSEGGKFILGTSTGIFLERQLDRIKRIYEGWMTACYAIKKAPTTKKIPVVMLTAIVCELNKKFSEDVLDADGYTTKPFTHEALLDEIRRL